ncbi:MAG TPA: TolC family protein [Candidatus Acidoferrum sp.]|nr:TolC family protein [Candidatus Acidoferrum sp.]
MMNHWGTAKSFSLLVNKMRSCLLTNQKQRDSKPGRSLLAFFLAAMLAIGPISPAFAQTPAQNPPSNPAPAAPPASQAAPIAPVSSLELSKHDFSNGPRVYPDLLKAYQPIHIENPVITNSVRLDQLVHDGKLELSLQDAVELALENSMDIVVERYAPWMADTSILKAKAGGAGQSTSGALLGSSTANLPFLSFDPNLTGTLLLSDDKTPVNNPLISGTGTGNGSGATLNHLETHQAEYNAQFTQGFETGTNTFISWDNTRSSSTSAANFLNPSVQSSLNIGFSQPLLSGFGLSINRRNILIAKNNRRIADWAFAQQAITTITNTITAYWELVYARANVKIEEQAVTVSGKLFSDNKKQLDAGTMSPLDVVTAESELATDRQNLIVAQTVKLQDEQILKNVISKDPLASNIVSVEIITTEQPERVPEIENPSFEDSMKEAFAKRPELQQQVYNLKNADIDIQATRNALLPALTISGQLSSVGLAGNSSITGAPEYLASGTPIVDANGNPILINGTTPIYEPIVVPTVTGTHQQGFTTAQNQVFHNRFPDYVGQLTLNLPLRNRSAQADSARAILNQREEQAIIQQLKNAAILDVRNTYIALTQGRAQVEAASKARELEQIAFDDEQKKYRLGASTVYNVILMQRDLITAQGTELRALANLEEAKANYERALGRTLEVNHVTVADAKSGQVERATLIPGTLHGKVVGTEDLFKDGGTR